MRFETISEGWVSRRQPGTPTAVAAGPRCAVTRQGDVVCTFMVQSKLGINDFQPMLARSTDGGRTWSEGQLLWPHLPDRYSIFGSVSRAPDGDLLYFGTRYPIDTPGETFWSEATQGLKANELIWSRSADGGYTWAEPKVIPMPIPGAAEAPGALTVTRSGRMICCYAPYNTFDPQLVVDRNQIVALRSDDRGRTWQHNSMIRFDSEHSTGAEAWVIELADGRLLGTTWHLNQAGQVGSPERLRDFAGRRRHVAADSLDRNHGPIDQPGCAARRPRVVHLQPAQARRARRVAGGGEAHRERLRHRVKRDRLARPDADPEREFGRTQRMDGLLVR